MLESAIGLYPQKILDDGIEATLPAGRSGHKSRGVPAEPALLRRAGRP
jgi:hypothetical protein